MLSKLNEASSAFPVTCECRFLNHRQFFALDISRWNRETQRHAKRRIKSTSFRSLPDGCHDTLRPSHPCGCGLAAVSRTELRGRVGFRQATCGVWAGDEFAVENRTARRHVLAVC